jgi:hypothetical protein
MAQSIRLRVEGLEDRALPSADWFSLHLPDPNVASLVRNDWNDHGSVNYNDMLAVYHQVAQSSHLSQNDFTCLKFLANNASILDTPAPVAYLEMQVVNHNPANASFEGHALGSLAVGCSTNRLDLLVDKWFLGEDHPAVAPSQGTTYVAYSGTLFGTGGPSYADVAQGQAGDCVLLSSLAVTANNDPSLIDGMFTDNANGTWTVRFYVSGSPVYVTVDNMLPTSPYGYAYYDQPQNGVLWVALAEKAYAELNAFDPNDGYTTFYLKNAYTTGSAGLYPNYVLNTLTGRAANFGYTPGELATALAQGSLVVLGTGQNTGSPYIVPDHEYAVVGYNASTGEYTLFNPWGVNADSEYGVWGLVTANLAYLEKYFNSCTAWVTAAPTSATEVNLSAFSAAPDAAPTMAYVPSGPSASAAYGPTGTLDLNVPATAMHADMPGTSGALHAVIQAGDGVAIGILFGGGDGAAVGCEV